MNLLAAASLLSLIPSGDAFALRTHRDGLPAGSGRNRRASTFRPASLASSTMDDVASVTTTTTTEAKRSFDSFDYDSHWYPVSWARDVPLNQPIRVTLFDVDYVLAKTSNADDEGGETFYAMVDECPHKKVALSEGRITERGEKRYFQCSYHGWTFDGESGECTEIPQTLIARTSSDGKPQPARAKKGGRREDATAVAVREAQGMVWIHPSRTPLEALAALETGELSPPPRIPEIDMEGYKVTTVVRDFPIDWTVLMENIMDPDHGYFAHSSSGTAAKGFDWYSSDGVDNQVQLEEEFIDGGGWKITSSVNAVEKLIKYNRNVRSGAADEEPTKDGPPPKLATTTLVAPSLIYMGRRTANSADSPAFLTGFWVCPTGAGRSRFMSAAIGKFAVPRWLMHVNLNNFLDQDTFLLCGQHRAVLKREAEGFLRGGGSPAAGGTGAAANDVRKSTYVYRSPSERMPVRVGQFFDATLARAPNRREGVLAWHGHNCGDGKLLAPWPSREEVLDRYGQHTRVCQDSMDVVDNCDRVRSASKAVGLALTFLKMVWRRSSPAASVPATLTNPFVSGVTFAAVRRLLSQSASVACGLADRIVASLLGDKVFYSVLALAVLSHSLASRLRREFFFKFDEGMHREDIKAIADNWIDL